MTLDDASKIAGILIPLGALLLAYFESRKWRRELIGKNQIELAQRIGHLAENFRIQFRSLVSTELHPSEYKDRPHAEEEKGFELFLDRKYALQQRFTTLSLILGKLSVANVEAGIIFERDFTEFLDSYVDATYKLNSAINQYFDLKSQFQLDAQTNDNMESARRILFGEDRELLKQVEDSGTSMKKYAKKFLKS